MSARPHPAELVEFYDKVNGGVSLPPMAIARWLRDHEVKEGVVFLTADKEAVEDAKELYFRLKSPADTMSEIQRIVDVNTLIDVVGEILGVDQ